MMKFPKTLAIVALLIFGAIAVGRYATGEIGKGTFPSPSKVTTQTQTVVEEESTVINVVEKVSPSVISIAVENRQLFNPFFTTKRAWKGTGLGLAVSFRIIQLFKGNIKVNTAVGKGTRFTIYIPLSKLRKRNQTK